MQLFFRFSANSRHSTFAVNIFKHTTKIDGKSLNVEFWDTGKRRKMINFSFLVSFRLFFQLVKRNSIIFTIRIFIRLTLVLWWINSSFSFSAERSGKWDFLPLFRSSTPHVKWRIKTSIVGTTNYEVFVHIFRVFVRWIKSIRQWKWRKNRFHFQKNTTCPYISSRLPMEQMLFDYFEMRFALPMLIDRVTHRISSIKFFEN